MLPRLVPDGTELIFLVFEGKQDLEKRIERRLRGWMKPDTTFVVLRDQDAAVCTAVKRRLTQLVNASGRSALVRVACRELEAWVAGDLEAVATAFDVPAVAREKNREKFRDPDILVRPVEELRRLLPEYQKMDGARRVGPLLQPDTNSSKSFRTFCAGVRRLFEPIAPKPLKPAR